MCIRCTCSGLWVRNVIFNDTDSCYEYVARGRWMELAGENRSPQSKTCVFATLYAINPTGLAWDRTRSSPVARRLQRWTRVRVHMLYSVLQPRSREDYMACALTRCASRGVQDSVSERIVSRKCARIVKMLFGFSSVNITRARQRRQVDLSPSGAKVTNECKYTTTTSHAVVAFAERSLLLHSAIESCLWCKCYRLCMVLESKVRVSAPSEDIIHSFIHSLLYFPYISIQGVTGGTDQTWGGCCLC
jgi:hypothetical protein